MMARVSCSPPLGQSTVVAGNGDDIVVNVLVEAKPTVKPWEVVLWHNWKGQDEWEELALESISNGVFFVGGRNEQSSLFSGKLPPHPRTATHTVVSFTVKFRTSAEAEWRWVNEQFSISDGQLVYQTFSMKSDYIHSYINGMDSEVEVTREKSDAPDAFLWSATVPVEAASGKNSGWSTYKLGIPKDVTRFMALVRLWSPWLAPRHGKEKFWIDKEGVMLSFLRKDGSHFVILAVSGVEDVLTTFKHDDDGSVVAISRNDSEKKGTGRLIISLARSFDVATAAAMYRARRMVMTSSPQSSEEATAMFAIENDDQHTQWLSEWYDGLTYCTWNGIGQNLTADAILKALSELEAHHIKITNLIIDDNWQSLDHEGGSQFQRGWTSFEANKAGFPDGMKALTTQIRQRHKNVAHIAVWHAILGYWGGVSPDGELAKRYKTIEVQKKPGVAGGRFHVVAAEDASKMYDDFYRFLSGAGIDSAKTDAQFFLDELQDAPDRRAMIREYQDAWSIAHLRHLGAKAISCMSQNPQILFHSQLPSNKPRLLVRNSDDFFPEVPASHPWHIFCNAHNSLLTQFLNVLPDWDMFQTSHPYAGFHAAARAVSGGPIYITDVPGQHDVELIGQMTAQTPRGNTIILRPTVVGKTVQQYAAYDEPVLLKVGTYTGRAQTGTSFLGVFNTTTRPLTELISLSSFPGTEEGEYVIRSHRKESSSNPVSRNDSHALIHIDVPVQGWDILSAIPVKSFTLKRKQGGIGSEEISFANLGLLGKMTGAAAIVNNDVHMEDTGRLRMWTSLKALGTIGVYISDLSNRSIEDDFMGLIVGKPLPPHTVKKSKIPNVLEIDLAAAWKDVGLQPGWSNEVSMELIIR